MNTDLDKLRKDYEALGKTIAELEKKEQKELTFGDLEVGDHYESKGVIALLGGVCYRRIKTSPRQCVWYRPGTGQMGLQDMGSDHIVVRLDGKGNLLS